MATSTLSILINQGIRSYYTEVCKIREIIQQSAERIPLPVSTIELAGGSIRCMLAGIHLAAR